MLKSFRATAASVALIAGMAGSAHADLTGDLVIFSDMSNPAPRAYW